MIKKSFSIFLVYLIKEAGSSKTINNIFSKKNIKALFRFSKYKNER